MPWVCACHLSIPLRYDDLNWMSLTLLRASVATHTSKSNSTLREKCVRGVSCGGITEKVKKFPIMHLFWLLQRVYLNDETSELWHLIYVLIRNRSKFYTFFSLSLLEYASMIWFQFFVPFRFPLSVSSQVAIRYHFASMGHSIHSLKSIICSHLFPYIR